MFSNICRKAVETARLHQSDLLPQPRKLVEGASLIASVGKVSKSCRGARRKGLGGLRDTSGERWESGEICKKVKKYVMRRTLLY